MSAVTAGQIGLGSMGGNVAACLLDADIDVVGFDVDEAACADLVDAGGTVADSAAAVADRADVLLSALNYPETVEEVYLGTDGVIAGAHEELICVEQSTIPPEPARELARALDEQGITLLDAPFLSGGPRFAREGTMVLPVGGDRSAYEDARVQAVLGAMSRETHHVGPAGSGKATKLVSNVMALGNLVLSLEALALGVGQGLDVDTLYDTLRYGAGSSVIFRVVLPAALDREFEEGFPVVSSQKDLRFARRAGEDVDLPMAMTSAALQRYTEAAASGYAEEDSTAVVKVFEMWLGESIETATPVAVEDDPVLNR